MTETARILIVDDTVINLQILGKILADSGYHVTAAKSAREALDFLQKKVPDMILLDVMMPVMDGFELCRTIKANPETEPIPVIFITALTETKDKVRGFKTGAVDYITKPLQPEEVLARVGTHLEIERQRRELEDLLATKDVFFSIISHDLRSPLSGLNRCAFFYERIDTFDDTLKRVVGEGTSSSTCCST
jgi:DNA-binding response OmpR family regulator